MSSPFILSSDLEEELKARNLIHFLLIDKCHKDVLFFEVYENESWHPILQSWGSVVGVHLNALMDRSPITDETGNKVYSGNLSTVKALTGFKWKDDWTPEIDKKRTDNLGYEYSSGWQLMSTQSSPVSTLSIKRRRRLTRRMIENDLPPSKVLPYELVIKILGGEYNMKEAAINTSYVEVFFNKTFLDKTTEAPLNWKKNISKQLMFLDPEITLTFALYIKKSSTVAAVTKTLTLGASTAMTGRSNGNTETILKGCVQYKCFRSDNIGVREPKLKLISPTGQHIATLFVRLELLETKLFSIIPTHPDSFDELRKHTESALSFELRRDIAMLDNSNNNLLNVLVSGIIEGKQILTEGDLGDVVREASFIQNISEIDEDPSKEPLDDISLPLYPCSKPKFTKLVTLPSSLAEKKSEVEHNVLIEKLFHKENELLRMNDAYDVTLPTYSSVFSESFIPLYGFDLGFKSIQKGDKVDYFELAIVSLLTDEEKQNYSHEECPSSIVHRLRWSSFVDYLHTLRELVKIQHWKQVKHLHETSDQLPPPFTTKSYYYVNNTRSWASISFTIDAEAEFLVIRETASANQNNQACDQLISFENVEGIEVKNTYHMSKMYNLMLRIHSASSSHLRYVANKCRIDIDTIDGRQRLSYKADSDRKVQAPQGQSVVVTFQESFSNDYSILLPPSALISNTQLNPDIDNDNGNKKEYVQITFNSEEDEETETNAVLGRLELPISNLKPGTGPESITETELQFSNMIEHYELSLKVLEIKNLIPMDLLNDAAADPHYSVYFADSNGQIIPLSNQANGSAGMVDAATAGVTAVGNVANNLVYLTTGGLAGKAKPATPEKPIKPVRPPKPSSTNPTPELILKHERSSSSSWEDHISTTPTPPPKPTLPAKPTTVVEMAKQKSIMFKQGAESLLHLGTGGMLGSKNTPAPIENDEDVSSKKKTGVVKSAGNVAVGAATGLLNLGTATIVGTKNITGAVINTSISASAAVVQTTGNATVNVLATTGNATVNVLTLGNAGIVSNKNKVDAIYQSSIAHKTLNPVWNEEFIISSAKYEKQIQKAKFILIQVWDKNTLADVCLGEVYIPIICAESVDPSSRYISSDVGLQKYPLQFSNHMKLKQYANKNLSTGLGTMKVQFTHKNLIVNYNEDDPVRVNVLLELKPIGALDFAWPCLLISASDHNYSPFSNGIDGQEQDCFHVQFKHEGFLITCPIETPYSERIKMLMECRERQIITKDKNTLRLLVPYTQLSVSEIYILNTNTLLCNLVLKRIFKEVDRPFSLDLLIGPCPAADFYTILHQRINLYGFKDAVSHLTKYTATTLDDFDAIAKDLQQEIFNTSESIQKLSLSTDATTLSSLNNVTNKLMNTKETEEEQSLSMFSKNSLIQMSITYFEAALPLRVLMVRKVFLKVFLWFLMEFSKSSAAKSYLDTSLKSKFEIDQEYIEILTEHAHTILKYGDETKKSLQPITDDHSSDGASDSNDIENDVKVIDTKDLVPRLQDILTQLDFNLRNLFFQMYRKNLPITYGEYLATQMVYQQYLVIVSYLASLLIDDDQIVNNNSNLPPIPPSQGNQNNAQENENIFKKSMMSIPGMKQTANLFNMNATNPTNNIHNTNTTVTTSMKSIHSHNQIDSQLKHELISFVISHDNFFEQYLEANIYSSDFKFNSRPVLSMCLDFDTLISKFAELLNENIQLWNSKAIKSIMCRKELESTSNEKLPWDVSILKDHATGNDLYISHIPESIQIQLNVQIGMKKIKTSAMGDNLSLTSIKRVIDINLKIAKAIAKAYLALAVEYEAFLIETIEGIYNRSQSSKSENVKKYAKVLGKAMLDVSTLGATYVLDIGIDGQSTRDGGGSGTLDSQQQHDDIEEVINEKDSDDLLCFLMSIINDSTRINKVHIPKSINSFVIEFSEDHQDNYNGMKAHEVQVRRKSEAVERVITPAEEIHEYFSNPIKAIKSVSQIAINYISNQVLFEGELKEYLLHGITDHLIINKRSSLLTSLRHSSLLVIGEGNEEDVDNDNNEDNPDQQPPQHANDDSPIAIIVATISDLYSYTEEHVSSEDQKRIVINFFKKLVKRYLLVLRDVLTKMSSTRLGSALNESINKMGIKKSISKLGKVSSQMGLGISSKDLDDSDDESSIEETMSSQSLKFGSSSKPITFNEMQINLIQKDLQLIIDTFSKFDDDKIVEVLQFFNSTILSIINNNISDPKRIDNILKTRFHVNPPVFNPDPLVYDTLVIQYIGTISSHPIEFTPDIESTEIESKKKYTLQFSDFSCVNLNDYKVCVVRITYGDSTIQSSILPSHMIGNTQIQWKDQLKFEHVKNYQSKEVIIEIVEIHPLGLRRDSILGRLKLPLNHIAQLISSNNTTNSTTTTNNNSNNNHKLEHTSWYVLETVPTDIVTNMTTTKGVTRSLSSITQGTISMTKNAFTLKNMSLGLLNNNNNNNNSTHDSDDGTNLSHHSNHTIHSTTTTTTSANIERTKNSYISMLSSTDENPRDHIKSPQLKVCVKIMEEK